MFYQSVVASVILYAVVCWGGSIKKMDVGRLDRLVRKAGDAVGTELDCLIKVAEKRTLSMLLTILDNDHHPLHRTFNRQRSKFSCRLLSLACSSDRLRRSFVHRAIQLYNSMRKGRGEMVFSAWVYLSLPHHPPHLIIPTHCPSPYWLYTLAPCTDLYSALSISFALSTQAAQEHFPPGHLHCHSQSCILYHRVRPILVSVTTPPTLNMFSSLCMWFVYVVSELYKLYKLLDVLKFPLGSSGLDVSLFKPVL